MGVMQAHVFEVFFVVVVCEDTRHNRLSGCHWFLKRIIATHFMFIPTWTVLIQQVPQPVSHQAPPQGFGNRLLTDNSLYLK